MKKKIIAIGCDHAGVTYKDAIIRQLEKMGYGTENFGTNGPESVDYPDFMHPVAEKVAAGEADMGIIICGSGNGAAMTANKHQTIRAALCWNNELAALAVQHNNANILAIPARFVSKRMAMSMVRTFLQSEFEGGRHARRVDKIACC